MRTIHRKLRGFSLLEVVLSVSIMTILVYSVFTVFDRTMKALDSVFVGAHRYEQVQRFFNQVSKELISAQIGATEHGSGIGGVYDFIGGPHWIEFGTMVVEKMTIEEYIQKGVNALIAVPRKVHYYGARRINYNAMSNDPPPTSLFENHVFRLIPVDNLEQNLLWSTQGDATAPQPPVLLTGYTNLFIPRWLEQYQAQQMVTSGVDGLVPDHLFSIKEMMVCRALRFEYFYDVVTEVEEDGTKTIVQYCQDWWDSRLRYPSFTTDKTDPTETDYYYHYYDNLPDYHKGIFDERDRRYNPKSILFTTNELWLYENEPLMFRVFDNNNLSSDGYPRLFDTVTMTDDAGGTLSPSVPTPPPPNHYSLVKAEPAEDDPWFNKPPAMVKISVYLLDPSKALAYTINGKDGSLTWKSKAKPTVNATDLEKKEAYKGELFSMMVYMRNRSSSIASYKRDMVQE
jgi:hypothetical protein